MNAEPEPPDRGPDGPAALDRPSSIVTIGGRYKSSAGSGERIEVKRYKCECHLDRLNLRGQITDTQWRAGIKYRRYWLIATMQTRVSGRYDEQPGGKSVADVSMMQSDARAALNATNAVLTTLQLLAVQAVAGCDETIARRLRYLQGGLDALADFWGIDRIETPCKT